MMNQLAIAAKRKRNPWIPQEDELLEKLVKKFQNENLGWKKISQIFKQNGFNRDTKACRERFANYHDQHYNKTKLSEQERDQLFNLIEIYGNKWTQIAEQLNNRTDQDIKNKFYAYIKKIIRRLIKAAYKTTESSFMIAKIQPLIISSIYCHDDNDNNNNKILKIDDQMKSLFKQLILNNKNIEVGSIIDNQTIEQVKKIMNYLDELNDNYIQQKMNKQSQKIQPNKLKTENANQSEQSQSLQQKIIDKIKNKQPIFTTKKVKIEQLNFTNNNSNQIDDTQSLQMGSNPLDNILPFYTYISPIIQTPSILCMQQFQLISADPFKSHDILYGYQSDQNSLRYCSDHLGALQD